ncbi:polysaccharide deacetylase [Marinobacter panjinensis]|uniref:Polysaccharide deacetylase n=1 Tax=Marinobacter panjinensis TaxID=2576384 RepID=A0A4U6R4J6_9GAMM|nr:polysaccharide deacetylase family protein [Marinobacter panjinensis]MCR8915817.1 polysaccharide deacetylase family protein [Marinobacter panjinensis]TKV67206.1 polysaccharide deacetylase [Marinobacter panjinensis]
MGVFSKAVRKLGPLGGYGFARALCKKEPRILMYHRFASPSVKGWASPEYFEQQVRYIKKNYNPFSLVGLMQYQRDNGKMPNHAVIITVDDGYRDFYEYAFPILKKYDVPATLFVTTGFIAQDLWLWPDKITWLLKQSTSIPELSLGNFFLSGGSLEGSSYDKYWQRIVDYSLSLPDQEKHQFLADLASLLGHDLPSRIPAEYAPLTLDELKEMQNSGIEIGGHTVTHPSLGRVTESQAYDEILGCRDYLNEHLGYHERTFCYPNGQPSDFQQFLPRIVREAGFLGAVTAFPDSKGARDPYLMRRHVSGDNSFQFYKAVSGVELLGHKLRGAVRLSGNFEEFAGTEQPTKSL